MPVLAIGGAASYGEHVGEAACPGRVDHRSWRRAQTVRAARGLLDAFVKGAPMSEATRSASSPAVLLVHGAFADAVLEIGGARK
jgi:hypothetical protein